MNDLWEIERAVHREGVAVLCGADEAGRGPLAGPVCAAAVILPEGVDLPGLNDSKKLTEKKREALFPLIEEKAVAYGIAFATVEEIEELNILRAALLAMDRAIARLDPRPALALIDGNTTKGISIPARSIVGGDAKCACIAAASVLAKVTRDRAMVELDATYPGYGLAGHKGYGTASHMESVSLQGGTPEHRYTYTNVAAAHARWCEQQK